MRHNFNQRLSIAPVEGKSKPPSKMISSSIRRLINNPTFKYNKSKLTSFGVNQLQIIGDVVSNENLDCKIKSVNVTRFLNLHLFYPEPAKIEIMIVSSDGRFLETSEVNSYSKGSNPLKQSTNELVHHRNLKPKKDIAKNSKK